MANYANLLAQIAANIYSNNNQDITGDALQLQLNAIVASLGAGYQFMGVAHPADTPSGYADLRAFWLAGDAGIYTNFGGLVLNYDEVAVIKYDGNGWSKESLGLDDNFVVADVSPNIYQGGILAGYIGSNGIVASTTLFRTIPIAIKGGVNYTATFSSYNFGSSASIAECDNDGNNVTIFYGVISGNTISFSRPTDTFVMLNVGSATDESSFMVCKTDSFPLTYTAYKKEIGEGYDFNDKMRSQIPPTGLSELITHHKSANLFNMNDPLNKNGYYSYGAFTSNANYLVTHPIAVQGGVTYKAMYPASSLGASNNRIPIVDKTNANILGVIIGTISGSTITFTPSNDCLVSLNVGSIISRTYDASVFIVSKLADYPAEYIPFYDYYLIDKAAVTKGPVSSKLFGKSVKFTGDSICAADTDTPSKAGWAKRIGEGKGMSWENFAVGGGTLIDHTLVGSSFTISDTDFGDGADYIILEGGTNDADRIGSILNGNVPALFGSYDLMDYTSNFTDQTFCGAVEMLLKKVVTTYPTAKVGFIIAPKMGVVSTGYSAETNNRRAYFEVIITLCKKWGVPVLNLWDECTMNPRLASHYTSGQNYLYVDGQHPTQKGYDLITPIIQSWMETL